MTGGDAEELAAQLLEEGPGEWQLRVGDDDGRKDAGVQQPRRQGGRRSPHFSMYPLL